MDLPSPPSPPVAPLPPNLPNPPNKNLPATYHLAVSKHKPVQPSTKLVSALKYGKIHVN